MIQKNYLFIFILIILSFTSCYNYQSVGLLQDDNIFLPKYEKVDFIEYKLRVNDEVIYRLMTSDETISKLITSDLATSGQYVNSYRIHPDGTIDLPFIKNIPVEGLTITEAGQVVEKRFKELIPDASIKLSIANKTFTIIGEASNGVFPIYKEKLTIYQALSMSGLLSYSGDPKRVRILRETDHGTKILQFDIRPKSIIESKYYYIYPNDIIYVQREPASFYKVSNYGSFIGTITTSLSFLFTVLYYSKF
ncbi:MAG: polysaccharide biosynthesis/export family protein [Paludibacter sp.]|nr:polysaccharide biosynthesis/export family protein [Paludibacter sp.]